MKKLYLLFIFFILTVVFTLTANAEYWPPQEYRTDWSYAGRPGGIPTVANQKNAVANYGAVGNGIADDTSAIQNCINGTSSGYACYIPNGTYKITKTLKMKSGVVVRGQSTTGTVIKATFSSGRSVFKMNGGIGSSTTLNEAGSLGETKLDLVNASGIDVGNFILIQQHSSDDGPSVGSTWDDNPRKDIVKVVGKSGNTITIERGLYNYYSGIYRATVQEYNMATNVGLETMTVQRVDSKSGGSNINWSRVADSWVYRVWFKKTQTAHIYTISCARLTIAQNYLEDTWVRGQGGRGYGTDVLKTFDSLIYDNIFYYLRHSMILAAGSGGNVFFANYSVDSMGDAVNWIWPDANAHGNYPTLNLFEHNIVESIKVDRTHGNNGPHTFFRNRVTKRSQYTTWNYLDNFAYTEIENNSINQYIIGNELGDPDESYKNSKAIIINEGTGSSFGHGNWIRERDSVSWNSSEADHNLPDSYFLTSRPSWWCDGEPWPGLGPESGNQGANSIPAKDRYDSRDYFTFCGSGTRPQTSIPDPPKNLRIIN